MSDLILREFTQIFNKEGGLKPIDPVILRGASHLVEWNQMGYGVIRVKGFKETGEGWKKQLWSEYFVEYKKRRNQRFERGIKIWQGKIELEIGERRIPIPDKKIFEVIRQHNTRIGGHGKLIPETNEKMFPEIRVLEGSQGMLCHVLVFSESEAIYKIFLRRRYACYTEIKFEIASKNRVK